MTFRGYWPTGRADSMETFPSCFCDQRLQAFELTAPDRFHVPVSDRIARLCGISNADGSYLHDIGLRSARKLDPISRTGGLSENDSTARDLCCHHPF